MSVRFYIFFFLFIFCSLSFFASGTIDSEDGWLYLNVARNVYYRHQLIATPQTDYPLHNVNMNSVKGADGIWRSPAATGYSLAMVPAVALSDIFHRYYHSPPAPYFPLTSDWTLLFFASFTNIFFASVLAITLLAYGIELGFTKRQAIALSLVSTFCTNLLPMSKFSFPQMMFASCLMLTFLAIKKRNALGLITLGLMVISYNISYLLALPALVLYFIATAKPIRQRLYITLSIIACCVLLFFEGTFLLPIGLGLFHAPKVTFEGLWGFLLSPGKSMFLYSPILLILPMFWHKIRKKMFPELISFGLLSAIFLILISSAWIGNPASKEPIWYGGMVWGPRYSTPLIPGLMILVWSIVIQLTRAQKRFILYPLLVVGLVIQIVGTSVIYLLQYTDLPYTIGIGQQTLSVYDYASFIPRYTALWAQPYSLIRVLHDFASTIKHGPYQVRFYDGFDMPFHASNNQLFRGFRDEGHIALHSATSIRFTLQNVPDTNVSSESAFLRIASGHEYLTSIVLPVWREITLDLPPRQLIDFSVSYTATPSAPHVIYIKNMQVNGANVNLGSLDYPDVSSIGYQTTPIPYQYYGGKVTDTWKLWDMRSRINERTFDFWWIKNLYYWDRPQQIVWALFVFDIGLSLSVLMLLIRQANKEL